MSRVNVRRFQLGDRVEAIVDHPSRNNYIGIGDAGTVCDLPPLVNRVGVKWDNAFPNGHVCSGHCKDGYGWYVGVEEVMLHDEMQDDIDEDSFMMIAFDTRGDKV